MVSASRTWSVPDASRDTSGRARRGGHGRPDVVIGAVTGVPLRRGSPQVFCDSPELRRHLGSTYLSAWLGERLGEDFGGDPREGVEPAREFSVPDAVLGKHGLIVGGSGSGKTSLGISMVAAQVLAGCSLVMLESKAESVRHLCSLLLAAGYPPERVTVVSAGDGSAGFNVFDAGLPLAVAAQDFVATLRLVFDSWGPRLEAILMAACLVAAAHRLSVLELLRLLVNDAYRGRLLDIPVACDDPAAYGEAVRFFRGEFDAWPKGTRVEAVAAVTNKLAEIVRNTRLASILCPERSTVDLAACFRSPQVIVVHLDRTGLGDSGTAVIGGLLATLAFRAALRNGSPGCVPLIMSGDELHSLQKCVPAVILADILSIARGHNFRLLGATQHFDQMDAHLQASFLANASFFAFFRLAYADANAVATALTAGSGDRLRRVTLAAGTGITVAEAAVTDGYGRPVKVGARAWRALQWSALHRPGGTLSVLRRAAAGSRRGRLYVAPAAVPLERYVAGLLPGDWSLAGPSPLRVAVAMPTPRVVQAERETERERQRSLVQTLMGLPVQHAVASVTGDTPAVVRVADVAPPLAADDPVLAAYLAAAVAANGVPGAEAAATRARREAAVERIAAGADSRPGPTPAGRGNDAAAGGRAAGGRAREEGGDGSIE